MNSDNRSTNNAFLQGTYQATLSIIDCSSAFTGIIILLASWYKPRTDSVFTTYAALMIAGLQLIGPILLAILRMGCLGHLKSEQPAYKPWHTIGSFLFAYLQNKDEIASIAIINILERSF